MDGSVIAGHVLTASVISIIARKDFSAMTEFPQRRGRRGL